MRKETEQIAAAIRLAQIETGLKLPEQAVLIAPVESWFDTECGLPVICVPTIGHWTLGNAPWKLTRVFEEAMEEGWGLDTPRPEGAEAK
jgi:hypothetical protein